MNSYVENNLIRKYLARYNLDETEENFNILKKFIQKKEYLFYEEIFKLTETCRIIESKSRSVIIEIDAENNSKLLDDISKKYLIKKISQRRIEKKLVTVTFWGIYSLR